MDQSSVTGLLTYTVNWATNVKRKKQCSLTEPADSERDRFCIARRASARAINRIGGHIGQVTRFIAWSLSWQTYH